VLGRLARVREERGFGGYKLVGAEPFLLLAIWSVVEDLSSKECSFGRWDVFTKRFWLALILACAGMYLSVNSYRANY